MELIFDCIPCFQRQALQAIRFLTDDKKIQEKVLRDVMTKLLECKWDSTPPELAHEVHKIVRNYAQNKDPYEKVKNESNELVLNLYPELKLKIEKSKDPLRTAIRLAIAGNIIDFGPEPEYNLEETIQQVLKKKFAIDHYRLFKERLKTAKTLLFFADNAGEIGFDKLLIETILDKKVFERISFVVKGGPIINDATLSDALQMGLHTLPNMKFLKISNGDPGTGPERKSQKVKNWIEDHDLVISKGQGNYEGLNQFNDIFFMLMAKCPFIASDLHVNKKDLVLKK